MVEQVNAAATASDNRTMAAAHHPRAIQLRVKR